MDETTEFVQNNKGILGTIVFLGVLIAILYVVYQYLYPADDPTYTQFLKGEADARRPVPIKGNVPAIYTGGDFTLSFWIYIDDWNYRVASSKFLFAISPQTLTPTSRSPLVGVLTPLQNGLMIRANTVGAGASVPTPGAQPAATGPAGPDITTEANLQALMNQRTSMEMFQTTLDTPCDVKEVPLQRWVNITIVSSGRVLDVYMDGKLSRSCVLENVVQVPRHGPLKLRLGENGGFGGRYSSVQMWSQQLTPDVIYGIYQMGPTQTQSDIFTQIAKWFNINVSFTGAAPGQPIPTATTTANPFSQLYTQGQADMSSAMGSIDATGQSIMSRF